MFQVGDKIYSWTKGGGCGHDYEFGIVTKVTKTGRFRVQIVEREYPKDDEGNKILMSGNVRLGEKYRIVPNFNKKSYTVLIKSDGTYTACYPHYYFEKYTDDLKLYGETDDGW